MQTKHIDTPEVVPSEINTSSITEPSFNEKSQQLVPELHCIDTSPAVESDLASADPCTMVPASELVVVAKDETSDKSPSPQMVERYTAAIELRSTIEISFERSYDQHVNYILVAVSMFFVPFKLDYFPSYDPTIMGIQHGRS
ncbi:hypothetical protein RUND412_008159 [Rhizina undulata]